MGVNTLFCILITIKTAKKIKNALPGENEKPRVYRMYMSIFGFIILMLFLAVDSLLYNSVYFHNATQSL